MTSSKEKLVRNLKYTDSLGARYEKLEMAFNSLSDQARIKFSPFDFNPWVLSNPEKIMDSDYQTQIGVLTERMDSIEESCQKNCNSGKIFDFWRNF